MSLRPQACRLMAFRVHALDRLQKHQDLNSKRRYVRPRDGSVYLNVKRAILNALKSASGKYPVDSTTTPDKEKPSVTEALPFKSDELAQVVLPVRKDHYRQRFPHNLKILPAGTNEDVVFRLIRAGFLHKAHTGIYHMLPLGLRVQAKAEALIDKHMLNIGASKVSLSSISSQSLWDKSGRLSKSPELFRFNDRMGSKYLLSPTHEEEITMVAKSMIGSISQLPMKLYQISRKYRDELRPRQGLLRSREFIMKDLYTFDSDTIQALETYSQVKEAYIAIFDELKIPYLIAEADSGDMGGDLSHEFHFPTPIGEDTVISCETCGYTANEEVARARVSIPSQDKEDVCWIFSPSILSKASPDARFEKISLWRGISKNRRTLVNVWYPSSAEQEVNPHAVKAIYPKLDSGVEDPLGLWLEEVPKLDKGPPEFINIFDGSIPMSFQKEVIASKDELNPLPPGTSFKSTTLEIQNPLSLTRIQTGDACPRCTTGELKVQKAIELGHTFFLGTRYTEPLKLTAMGEREKYAFIAPDKLSTVSDSVVHMFLEMGCHGIGVTRMIGAVAQVLSGSKGLKWPRVLAPYEVVITATKHGKDMDPDIGAHLEGVYDVLTQNGTNSIDAVLDDRSIRLGGKLPDYELIGIPIVLLLGRAWARQRKVSVKCEHLNIEEGVGIDELREFVEKTLERL